MHWRRPRRDLSGKPQELMRAVSVAIDSLRQGDRAGELTRRGLAHLCCQFDSVAANSGLELLTAHFGMHRFLKELGGRDAALFRHFMEIRW